MPRVLNKYKDYIPSDAVYVGRGSKWGNPFIIGRDGIRNEVIKKYKEWLRKEISANRLNPKELKGKDLVCFCAPKNCHGDVLLRLANK